MNPKALALCATLVALSGPASAQTPTWTQTGMLSCKLNPSIGFIIVGHQSMECRFVPSMPGAPQFYEGALNTVGIDIGVIGGGALAWGVLAPVTGVPARAPAGTPVTGARTPHAKAPPPITPMSIPTVLRAPS